ncbi:DUF1491 family protein [Sphingobium yanoikuyae]|uniref:DUF1491 family protein n=1 Tax=Sphingobium yanoikuyae TaxID=13690 RepID=A0A6P1GLP6_SPHYA|nr:DUF1491 family protein [Sphingobium yanoikuyae]
MTVAASCVSASTDVVTLERLPVLRYSSTQIAQGPERDIDAITTREAGFDPDLWVIEIESRDGRTLLDQDGLA